MEPNQQDAPLSDEWGELLSAYVDGQVSRREAAVVERRLAEDPLARRFVEDLRAMSGWCRESAAGAAPRGGERFAAAVVAEALRRESEDRLVELPDRLEPEGDFGLPFGKSSRSWSWGLVAAAAAVLIGFYGRPAAPTRPTAQQIERGLADLQRSAPDLRVVNYQATPDRVARLRELLAAQTAGGSAAPDPLRRVSLPAGVRFQPADGSALRTAALDGEEEVLCVDADPAELDRLLTQLDRDGGGATVRVGGDASPPPAIRGVWRVQIDPQTAAAGPAVAAPVAQATAGGARRLVVLRLRITPAQ